MFEILRVYSVSTFTFNKYKVWKTKGLNPQPASQVLVQLISVEARGPIIRYNLELNSNLLRYIIIVTHTHIIKKGEVLPKTKKFGCEDRRDLTHIFFLKVVKKFKSGETCLVMSKMYFYSSAFCKQRMIIIIIKIKLQKL